MAMPQTPKSPRLPDLPCLPYYPGVALQLYPSSPPPRPVQHWLLGKFPAILYRFDSEGRRLEYYRDNFFLPLPQVASPASIRLETPIRANLSTHLCQVFLATVLPSDATMDSSRLPPTFERLVAKIYDPLYFFDPAYEADPALYVDTCLANEIEAYDRLSTIQGTFIPRCYGCYICPVPGQNRNVWVLLLQHIPGPNLSKSDPSQLSSVERRIVMDKVVDAACHIARIGGIYNRNYAPKNTILWPNDSDDTTKSVDNSDEGAVESGVTSASNTLPTSVDLSTSRVFILGFDVVRFSNLSSRVYQQWMKLVDDDNYEHDLCQFEAKGWVTAHYEGKRKYYRAY
jgi:hypothetical protein